MKVFIVFAHPDPTASSFNHALLNAAVDALKRDGSEVKVSNLYKMRFLSAPSMADFTETKGEDAFVYQKEQESGHFSQEIKDEQEKIEWAEYVVFLGPMMWGSLSSVFYAYIDRVFALGKAYTMERKNESGLYAGKKFFIATTTGNPRQAFQPRSVLGTVEQRMIGFTLGCAHFCGFKVLRTQAFFAARDATNEVREDMINKWKTIITHLDRREEIHFYPLEAYDNGVLKDTAAKMNAQNISELGDIDLNESYERVKPRQT